MTGVGFRAGTPVKIVFDAPRHTVVGSAVARRDGTFKALIVVPVAGPGRHKLQAVGTDASGQPTTLAAPVLVLASSAAMVEPANNVAEPVLLTISLALPLATWLTFEMLGWRRRRFGQQKTGI